MKCLLQAKQSRKTALKLTIPHLPPCPQDKYTKRSHSAKTCKKKEIIKKKAKESKLFPNSHTTWSANNNKAGKSEKRGVDGNEAAKKCSQSASQAKVKDSQGNRIETNANPTKPNQTVLNQTEPNRTGPKKTPQKAINNCW